MSSDTELLPIGELAERTGTAVSALRYYDEIGLVVPRARVSGQRRFDPDAVGRVSFIRRAQAVGFSLEEIGSILDEDRAQSNKLVEAKLDELSKRRERLDTMIALLGEIRNCDCVVVESCAAESL